MAINMNPYPPINKDFGLYNDPQTGSSSSFIAQYKLPPDSFELEKRIKALEDKNKQNAPKNPLIELLDFNEAIRIVRDWCNDVLGERP